MEIKTRLDTSETTVKKDEEEEQPLSPAARVFHSPEFNCYVISVIGVKKKIETDVIIEGLKQSLIRHPRFSSKLVSNGNKKRQTQSWVRTNVVVNDHVIVPDIQTQNIENGNANVFLESYVSNLTTVSLDISKPLWQLHLLDLKTSDAENVAVLKFHHSLGDGMSLMALVLACMRKTSNPDELPSLPNQNRSSSRSSRLMTGSRGDSRFLWLVMVIWSAIMLVLNTVCDALEFIATTMFLKDTETPIKGDFRLSKSKRMCLVHRTVSLDDIKLIKTAMKMTVNDVVLGVSQAGLSQYLERRYGEKKKKVGEDQESKKNSTDMPKAIRLRSALLVNLRPNTGIQDLADMMAKGSKCRWGNWIGYIVFPFSIGLRDDPLEHLQRAKRIIDRKKNSLEAALTFVAGKFIIKTFGVEVAAKIINRALSNTTMSFSNLIGPIEEISFYGHPITYMAPSVYGHPHALTMHFQSYMNQMTISLTVDPTVISDPHRLLDDWEKSLQNIKAAVQERGSRSLD
ncbi:O-acyltransferase WSD1 N-terminal [Arabidopsis thaliana x Arabidopsis arenosa]|uniref:O-acyltransferase WSD1 N-terminal n=1 Tax=Arabidopsis thaliana x Arabidopsis arenosa TaxID=1240361 RepID=A0A8T1ZNP2_9BRAS|nr:O-acyltransferase WSD1 N-terminal [Arabidopsis thaliana x Arabidopsis arenosa]